MGNYSKKNLILLNTPYALLVSRTNGLGGITGYFDYTITKIGLNICN